MKKYTTEVECNKGYIDSLVIDEDLIFRKLLQVFFKPYFNKGDENNPRVNDCREIAYKIEVMDHHVIL